jgi:ethanolamine transporter EutH
MCNIQRLSHMKEQNTVQYFAMLFLRMLLTLILICILLVSLTWWTRDHMLNFLLAFQRQ